MMNKIKLFLTLVISLNVLAVPEGAFNTLMVQAKDVNKYIEYMKANTGPFEAIGSDVAGVCVTKSGNDYPGQMFVWNAFSSVEKALAASDLYDPMNTSSGFNKQRKVMYSATFKPLKVFELKPGSERLWRLKLNNPSKYAEKLIEIEKAMNEAGHEVRIGLFAPIAGGKEETGMFHLRGVSNTAAESGAAIDDFYAGASWASLWDESMEYIDEVVTETMEKCEVIYTAE